MRPDVKPHAKGPISVFYVAIMLAGAYGWTWKVLVAMFAAPGIFMLFLSRLTTEWSYSRVSPNEGIRRSARNGLIVGLATALILGAGFGVPEGLPASSPGCSTGAERPLSTMGRTDRPWRNPWKYQPFLDEAVSR